MRTELLDPCTDARWEDFVGRASGATMFHHPAWLTLLAASYRYDFAASCVLDDDDDRVVAGLPWARIQSRLTGKRLVALPFSDACPPLLDGASEEELARAVDEHRTEAGLGLEVRWRMDALDGQSVHRYWRHTLPLEEDAAAVERRARSGIRRGAKKARKAGLAFEQRTDADALDAFYALHLQTRRHQGVPTQSKRFIAGFGPLFDRGHGFVALVSDEGRPVAAAVFLRWREHLIYKYGASDRSALAARPNNLLFSEVIRWGCEAGCRELDFGRTDLDHEGLREFKLGWGTEELALHHTYAGMAVPDAGESAVQSLLVPVIRRSPASVSRLIGVALYRHFG